MNDVALQTALARLAPDVDARPEWDDVVRRGALRPRVGWKVAAIVAATLLATGIVAGALAKGVLSGSLERLSSWVGDHPGERAPEQQASFDQDNALSYAHFPAGTQVGRLLTFEFQGRSHEILGFRDGSNLCIRLAPPLFGSVSRPECVPTSELSRLGEPIAMLGGSPRGLMPGNSGASTIAYGLAADSVLSVEAVDDGRSLGAVDVHNNAFFMAVPHPFHASGGDPNRSPPVFLRVRTTNGVVDVPVKSVPFFARDHVGDIPGPARVERTLETGSVGWLERREPRGEPFDWPYDSPSEILYSRVVAPDPTSSFRLGVAFGQDADWREHGRWYCLAWFWPLVPDSLTGRGCTRADTVAVGPVVEGTWPSGFGEFPQFVGIASDEVNSLKVFYEDGSTKDVPLVDNLFSFYVDGVQGSKLVAYDAANRVVRVMRLT
jgi:hypothetical protein